VHTSVLKGTDFNNILKWYNFISHPRQTDWVKLQISNSHVARLGSCNGVLEDASFMGCNPVSLEVQFNTFPTFCEEHRSISFL
jgi:hypothetical protein